MNVCFGSKADIRRFYFLFGDDIPDELVKTAVSLVYAENDTLKTK